MKSSQSFYFARCMLVVQILFILVLKSYSSEQRELNIRVDMIDRWARNLTSYLLSISDTATGAGYLEEYYQRNRNKVTVEVKDVAGDLMQVKNHLDVMLQKKIDAVERVAKAAEDANKQYGKYKAPEELQMEDFEYYNAKKLVSDVDIMDLDNETQAAVKRTIHYLPLGHDRVEFNDHLVNFTVSTIHVPTNIYDKSSKILNGVKWSNDLTDQFRKNAELDPTLTWQYFGSADGFFRIYPGIKWPRDPNKVDMFDCRIRNWYIQAATSPKNVVILLDTSGSMKGLRLKIAQSTVEKILDTLSNDDYFNVLKFSSEVFYVDPCFNRTLMHASVDNRKRMQKQIKRVGAEQMADFKKALIEAFELFRSVERHLKRTLCNKVIMLITDGAPENYEGTFDYYNWPNKTTRVFTYLIGKEVQDNRQVQWMACANKGDHTHISTRADVQENVQQYIKVLSRPMVQEKFRNMILTAVYLDYPTEQASMVEVPEATFSTFTDLLAAGKKNAGLGLVMSVAMPVFDHRESVPVDGKKNSQQESHLENLLGVAGTDISIYELMQQIPMYKLGVNGYAFAITNNGYIIFHPDFRPMFVKESPVKVDLAAELYAKPNYNSVDLTEEELTMDAMKVEEFPPEVPVKYEQAAELHTKPNYNSVDLTEVELAIDVLRVEELRNVMLDPQSGGIQMNVTFHYDGMKRARMRGNQYYYNTILNTFSLAFVIPNGYGMNKLRLKDSVLPADVHYLNDPEMFIAPWVFCRKEQTGTMYQLDKEELSRLITTGQFRHSKECDPDQLRHLVLDAKVTDNYTKLWKGLVTSPQREDRQFRGFSVLNEYTKRCFTKFWNNTVKERCVFDIHKEYGIELIFVGTSSGLTRFLHVVSIESIVDQSFYDTNRRTILDLYYQRAVHGWEDGYNYTFHLRNPTDLEIATVIMSTPEVIAKHDRRRRSVAAVVGFQMKFDKFKELFFNVTSHCPRDLPGGCDYTCNDTEYMSCYLIDNSGFVMASNNIEDYGTGEFFGVVDGSLMNELIIQHVFEEIEVTDYQGVCEVFASDGESSASFVMNPLKQMFGWITWVIARTVLLLSEWNFYSWISNSFQTKAEETDYDGFVEKNIVKFYNRFTVSSDPEIGLGPLEDKLMYYEGCDKLVNLYNFNMTTLRRKNTMVDTITGCGNCRSYTPGTYVVRWLQDTNMILVVAATNCSCGYNEEFSLVPEKIIYNETEKCQRNSKLSHLPKNISCYDSTIEKKDVCGSCSIIHCRLHIVSTIVMSLLVASFR